jgi:hypothetical protein
MGYLLLPALVSLLQLNHVLISYPNSWWGGGWWVTGYKTSVLSWKTFGKAIRLLLWWGRKRTGQENKKRKVEDRRCGAAGFAYVSSMPCSDVINKCI